MQEPNQCSVAGSQADYQGFQGLWLLSQITLRYREEKAGLSHGSSKGSEEEKGEKDKEEMEDKVRLSEGLRREKE